MLPSNFQALVVILLAIVPGFVATRSWSRAKTYKGPGTDLSTVLQSLALSLVIQIILAPVTVRWLYPIRTHFDQYPARITTWLALAVLVLPVFGGTLYARLSDAIYNPYAPWLRGRLFRPLNWFFPPAPAPAIWDWLFTANIPDGYFLVVEFNDGHRVAGVFAQGSFALTSPETQGVFLSREWSLDEHGDLVAEVPGTNGVMIANSTNIRTVRILKGS